MKTIGHLINGEQREEGEQTQLVYNPATGEATKELLLANDALVDEAIEAAKVAFQTWRNEPPIKRARVMFRYKQLLEEHKDEICRLIGEEHEICQLYNIANILKVFGSRSFCDMSPNN